MEIFTTNVAAAARLGAACSGVSSAWTNALATGANHALGRKLSVVGGTPDARRAASWGVEPMSVQTQQQFAVLRGAELRPTTVRKPNNVHTTRIAAGGYGAMGPHPERERLA